MQMVGGPPTQLVTMNMLRAAKMQYEAGNATDGAVHVGEAELYDLSAMMDPALVQANGGADAGVLVLRGFAQRLMGEDAPAQIEHELELQMRNGKIDKQANMYERVVTKHARWNNVMAGYDQEPDIANKRGTIVRIADYPFINYLTSLAAMWMQQDNPLVCEQNRYYDVFGPGTDPSKKGCGIGWHGDKEREIVFGYRAGKATEAMPLYFQAHHWYVPVGPKTCVPLRNGDVYIMSSKAVGTDYGCPSLLTWRHAAGNPDVYKGIKDNPSAEERAEIKRRKEERKEAKEAKLQSAIDKSKKIVRTSPFVR